MRTCDPLAILQAYVRLQGTQKTAALRLGVSQSYLSDLLNKRRDFPDKLLARLGLRRIVVSA